MFTLTVLDTNGGSEILGYHYLGKEDARRELNERFHLPVLSVETIPGKEFARFELDHPVYAYAELR